jgi:hypothetical protein
MSKVDLLSENNSTTCIINYLLPENHTSCMYGIGVERISDPCVIIRPCKQGWWIQNQWASCYLFYGIGLGRTYDLFVVLPLLWKQNKWAVVGFMELAQRRLMTCLLCFCDDGNTINGFYGIGQWRSNDPLMCFHVNKGDGNTIIGRWKMWRDKVSHHYLVSKIPR